MKSMMSPSQTKEGLGALGGGEEVVGWCSARLVSLYTSVYTCHSQRNETHYILYYNLSSTSAPLLSIERSSLIVTSQLLPVVETHFQDIRTISCFPDPMIPKSNDDPLNINLEKTKATYLSWPQIQVCKTKMFFFWENECVGINIGH